jgi:preprotein translocase subunit SecE
LVDAWFDDALSDDEGIGHPASSPEDGAGPVACGTREDMARFNPIQFFQEVRQETSKVTWPTRKEVTVTTVAVLIMVTVASIFFLLADQLLGYLVSSVLRLGR